MSSNRVKIFGLNIAIFAGFVLAVSVVAAPPVAVNNITPGETRYFKDWAAGCDNTLSCQAIAMQPLENGEGYLTLSLARDSGKGRTSIIEITGMDSDVSKYQIYADKRLILSGTLKGANDSIALTARDSARLVRSIPNGQELRVTGEAGKQLGRISLSGSSAALRYLDSQQKRAAKPLPVITVKRIAKGELIPETGDLVALAENGKCTALRQGVTEDSAYSLGSEAGNAKALALISCGNGAYNFSSAAFIGTRGNDAKWKFEPAKFDYAGAGVGTDAGKGDPQKILTNATWDPGKQMLNSYNKGRAIADCGITEDYVWDGTMFRLMRAEQMKECQGAPVWITIWRAAAKFIS
jgi:hypothetical protein